MAAADAVVNVFAGLTRGTQARIDLNPVRSAACATPAPAVRRSTTCAPCATWSRASQLPTNRSVAAVAGMEGVAEGLRSVAKGRFAGKVVIYPNLRKPLPADAARPGDGAASRGARLDERRHVDERGRSELLERCYESAAKAADACVLHEDGDYEYGN
jgi:hypothetical protein